MRKATTLLTLIFAMLCLSSPVAIASVGGHRQTARTIRHNRRARKVGRLEKTTRVVVRTTSGGRVLRRHRRTDTKATPASGSTVTPPATAPGVTGTSSPGTGSTTSHSGASAGSPSGSSGSTTGSGSGSAGTPTSGSGSAGTPTSGSGSAGTPTSGSGSTGTPGSGSGSTGTTGSGSGSTPSPQGSTPFFTGTFTSPDEWQSVYGSCAQALNNTSVQFTITPSCDPAGNGHYRTDLCSSSSCNGNGTIAQGDVYQAGQPTCTSIPVNAVNVPTVTNNGWMMFAEAKDNSATTGGWAFMINSYYTGVNQFAISFGTGISDTSWDGTMTPGWHTLSICTNNANNSSGEVYGIYEDGVRLTFNHGSGTGQQTLTGFPIINNGMSSWPLDIDDYTGGAPTNQIMTGAPLIASGTDNPPMPAGGWNNA
jgi:hypothetical protein